MSTKQATWRMANGREIRICDMDDRHLANTIKMLERKRAEGATTFIGGFDEDDEPFCDEENFFDQRAEEYEGLCHERNRRLAQWALRVSVTLNHVIRGARNVQEVECPVELLNSF